MWDAEKTARCVANNDQIYLSSTCLHGKTDAKIGPVWTDPYFLKDLCVKVCVEFCSSLTAPESVWQPWGAALAFDGTIDGKVVRKVTEPQRNLITFIHYPHSERRRNSPSVIRFISIVNTCPACLPLLSLSLSRSLSQTDFFKQAFNEIINVFLCSCKYSLILFRWTYVLHIWDPLHKFVKRSLQREGRFKYIKWSDLLSSGSLRHLHQINQNQYDIISLC